MIRLTFSRANLNNCGENQLQWGIASYQQEVNEKAEENVSDAGMQNLMDVETVGIRERERENPEQSKLGDWIEGKTIIGNEGCQRRKY